jgi:hypothetical protein
MELNKKEYYKGQERQINNANMAAAVQALAKAGKIDEDTAKRILDIAEEGGRPETVIQKLKEAVESGNITMQALQAVAALLQNKKAR